MPHVGVHYVGQRACRALRRPDRPCWVGGQGEGVRIDQARHFVMIDQPEKFDSALYAAIEADAKGS